MQTKKLFLLSILSCLLLLTSTGYGAPKLSDGPTADIDGIGTVQVVKNITIEQAQDPKTAAYDLSKYDGDVWHYARLTVFKDSTKTANRLANLLNSNVNGYQMEQIGEQMKKWVTAQFSNDNGAALLVTYPAEIGYVGEQRAWVFPYTLTMAKELPMPVYVRLAVYANRDQPVIVMLLCADSDRKFWEPIVKNILRSAQ